jgi:hypothetical protein
MSLTWQREKWVWPGILVDGGDAGVLARGATAVGGGQGGAALLQVPGLQAALYSRPVVHIVERSKYSTYGMYVLRMLHSVRVATRDLPPGS